MKYIAITACPTGIAHTYMAAENLEKIAKELGHEIKVETQGAMGIENELTPEDVSNADTVIFASDILIENSERFDGKPKIEVPVQLALKNPKSIFEKKPV